MTQSIFLQCRWECRTQWSQRSRPVVLKWLTLFQCYQHTRTGTSERVRTLPSLATAFCGVWPPSCSVAARRMLLGHFVGWHGGRRYTCNICLSTPSIDISIICILGAYITAIACLASCFKLRGCGLENTDSNCLFRIFALSTGSV